MILSRLATILRSQDEAKYAMVTNEKGEEVEPRHFYIVDELAAIGKIPELPNLARTGRSRGVSITLCSQNPPGLVAELGKDLLDELVDLCNSRGTLRTDGPSAEIVAKWLGDTLTEDSSIDDNTDGYKTGFGRGNIIEASEVRQLPDVDSGKMGVIWKYKAMQPFREDRPVSYFSKGIWERKTAARDEFNAFEPITEADDEVFTLRVFEEEDYTRLQLPEELRENLREKRRKKQQQPATLEEELLEELAHPNGIEKVAERLKQRRSERQSHINGEAREPERVH